MPKWNPGQYLRFAEERTRPCRDLASNVRVAGPKRIIDLGCGPGNSTEVVAQQWPEAAITGLDSSASMIEAARKSRPEIHWATGNISDWASATGEKFDIVFSNAALQWVDDHAGIYPRLLARVAPGGAFACQVPGNYDGPPHRLMREIAASNHWRNRLPEGSVREWAVHDLPFYYDVLAPVAARVDMWETEYMHIFGGAEDIVEWYKGAGLRPFLEALESETDRNEFIAEYLDGLRAIYATRADGHVLFPFRRLFVVAYQV